MALNFNNFKQFETVTLPLKNRRNSSVAAIIFSLSYTLLTVVVTTIITILGLIIITEK